jgi:hypothetical protein
LLLDRLPLALPVGARPELAVQQLNVAPKIKTTTSATWLVPGDRCFVALAAVGTWVVAQATGPTPLLRLNDNDGNEVVRSEGPFAFADGGAYNWGYTVDCGSAYGVAGSFSLAPLPLLVALPGWSWVMTETPVQGQDTLTFPALTYVEVPVSSGLGGATADELLGPSDLGDLSDQGDEQPPPEDGGGAEGGGGGEGEGGGGEAGPPPASVPPTVEPPVVKRPPKAGRGGG